jgi:hypothetical protein
VKNVFIGISLLRLWAPMLVHFGRQAKKRDTQKTMNFVHLQKREKDEEVLRDE